MLKAFKFVVCFGGAAHLAKCKQRRQRVVWDRRPVSVDRFMRASRSIAELDAKLAAAHCARPARPTMRTGARFFLTCEKSPRDAVRAGEIIVTQRGKKLNPNADGRGLIRSGLPSGLRRRAFATSIHPVPVFRKQFAQAGGERQIRRGSRPDHDVGSSEVFHRGMAAERRCRRIRHQPATRVAETYKTTKTTRDGGEVARAARQL